MKTRVVTVFLLLLIAAISIAGVKYWVQRSKCSGCGDCYVVCPVDAIEIVDGKSEIDPRSTRMPA